MMRAITLWQSWASLVAIGAKPYEFRSWAAPSALVGQRIAIHAGARTVRLAEVRALIVQLRGREGWRSCLRADVALPFLDRLLLNPGAAPLGCIVATAVLGLPTRSTAILEAFGGAVNDSDRGAHFNFAWPLRDVEEMRPPIPARGAQGFFEVAAP